MTCLCIMHTTNLIKVFVVFHDKVLLHFCIVLCVIILLDLYRPNLLRNCKNRVKYNQGGNEQEILVCCLFIVNLSKGDMNNTLFWASMNLCLKTSIYPYVLRVRAWDFRIANRREQGRGALFNQSNYSCQNLDSINYYY